MDAQAPGTIWKAIGIAAVLHVIGYALFLWSPYGEVPEPAGSAGIQLSLADLSAPPAPETALPPEPDTEPVPEIAEPEPEEPVEEEAVEEVPPPTPDIPLRKAESRPPKPEAQPKPAAPAQKAGGPQGQAAQQSAPSPFLGNADAQASYVARLQAWLARHKRYPRTARRRGVEGDAVLRFVVDRAGSVRSFGLDKGTGSGLLDREVREMLERASPLPPVPADFGAETVEVVITVRFNLD